MERSLATLAFFAVALLAMLTHRIRRDTGDRVDTRYFQLATLGATARVMALTLGLLAGIPSSHPALALASVATGLQAMAATSLMFLVTALRPIDSGGVPARKCTPSMT